MLRKHEEIEIPEEDPFTNDQLNRKPSIENLSFLVETTSQPFVMSIESPWGWGKTTFLRMWKSFLENQGHCCLLFNAWENDFADDPLIAFIGEMTNLIKEITIESEGGGLIHEKWATVKNIGGGVLRKGIPIAIQLATQGLLSKDVLRDASDAVLEASDELAKLAADIAEERIKQYEEEKNGITTFKENLMDLARLITSEDDKKGPLIIFIDEIDRCRPNYGIELLERIKHLFSVDGLFFVLAIDRHQIKHSIRSVYGTGMDAEGYLRRFIDLSYRLPPPEINDFCSYLFTKFDLHEVFKNRKESQFEPQSLVTRFSELARSYSLSLREVEQCFTEINLVLRTTSPKFKIYPPFFPSWLHSKHIIQMYTIYLQVF